MFDTDSIFSDTKREAFQWKLKCWCPRELWIFTSIVFPTVRQLSDLGEVDLLSDRDHGNIKRNKPWGHSRGRKEPLCRLFSGMNGQPSEGQRQDRDVGCALSSIVEVCASLPSRYTHIDISSLSWEADSSQGPPLRPMGACTRNRHKPSHEHSLLSPPYVSPIPNCLQNYPDQTCWSSYWPSGHQISI